MLYGKGAACVCEGTVQSDSSGAKNPVAGVTTVGWKSHGAGLCGYPGNIRRTRRASKGDPEETLAI